MTALALIEELAASGIRLSRRGDKLVVAPKTALNDMLKAKLLAAKPALLSVLPDPNGRPRIDFRLPGHAANSWATAIGAPGETLDSLIADLRVRWPNVEVRQ
jgi:hypothetical protein